MYLIIFRSIYSDFSIKSTISLAVSFILFTAYCSLKYDSAMRWQLTGWSNITEWSLFVSLKFASRLFCMSPCLAGFLLLDESRKASNIFIHWKLPKITRRQFVCLRSLFYQIERPLQHPRFRVPQMNVNSTVNKCYSLICFV